jgi:hypothetical protein
VKILFNSEMRDLLARGPIDPLWRIACASGRTRDGVCALVSILDDTSIEVAARRWIEFEPSCKLAFFCGPAADYGGDLEAALGANLILPLDSREWGMPFADFATTVSQLIVRRRFGAEPVRARRVKDSR